MRRSHRRLTDQGRRDLLCLRDPAGTADLDFVGTPRQE